MRAVPEGSSLLIYLAALSVISSFRVKVALQLVERESAFARPAVFDECRLGSVRIFEILEMLLDRLANVERHAAARPSGESLQSVVGGLG